jgi:type II secretory pathway pseudopilin PulG
MTLVELMMAISVMGVLTVLLLGSMSAMYSHTSSASNQANLMQLGMAMSMYTDNTGAYPPLAFSVNGTQVEVVARSQRESGFDAFDESLFLSPYFHRSINAGGQTDAHTVPIIRLDGETEDLPVTYGYNIELLRSGLRVRQMATPHQRVVLFDGSMSGPDGGGLIEGDYQLSGAAEGVLDRQKWLEDAAYGRQLRFIDALYADGHAERKSNVAPDEMNITHVP